MPLNNFMLGLDTMKYKINIEAQARKYVELGIH